jgi:hypothetical protein
VSDSDISDDIVADELPQHLKPVPPLRADFRPWHRVRKQFIREKQWNHEIHFLTKQLRRELQKDASEWGAGTTPGEPALSTGPVPETLIIERPLRCFVLPGDELLDIRCLWQKLEGEGCFIRFLGFNSTLNTPERQERMALTEGAVTQLAKISKDSHVTGDRFQDIARNNTQAYRLFRQYGPYDVINLDLCDSLVPRGKAGETGANYSALHQVLIYQSQHQRTPWLLFATTQVDRETVDQTELDKLGGPTRKNFDAHPEFASALGGRLPANCFSSQAHSVDISEFTPNHLVEVFGIILGKWLVDILQSASPRCSVKLLPSYRYVIRPDKSVEMLSLGFRVTPHFAPPTDQTGISSLKLGPANSPSEKEIAVDMVEVASRIRNVDVILAGDLELRDNLVRSKADLLSAAGFDSDAYRKWVADGELEAS